jgi:phage-related protein (TIGR01555 family)
VSSAAGKTVGGRLAGDPVLTGLQNEPDGLIAGTGRDSSTAYTYEGEGLVPDMELSLVYESNGIFSKIIDQPAEETMKRGYDFEGLDDEAKSFVNAMLDFLDWDEQCISAVKWSRLFGGALCVMLIDDGGELYEPLNHENIRSVEEILVFERSVVQPDYNSMYQTGDVSKRLKHGRSNFGKPEYYDVFSQYGHFRVHESRCLVFRNGRLPELSSQMLYRFWGAPEYLRVKNKLQETDTSATYAVELLERCVQPVYAMKGLSSYLETDDGRERLQRHMQALAQSQSLLNWLFIDAEGERVEFQNASIAGINEIIGSTCNMLSAVTNIPQTLLFGSSPAGMNATGESDFENYYSFIERIQKTQIQRNFEKLVDIILVAAQNRGLLQDVPDYRIKFNPLKTVSEQDQAAIEQQRAGSQQIKAATAQVLVDMGVLDPSEVRNAIGKEGDWQIENILDDLDEEALLELPEGAGETAEVTGQEPAVASSEAAAAEAVSSDPDVQDIAIAQEVSLNGAQISGLLSILDSYKTGTLSRESAIQVIMASYPFDRAKAESLVGEEQPAETADAKFSEADHPRADNGKFGKGSGGGGSSGSKRKSGGAAEKDHMLSNRTQETQAVYDRARQAEKVITSDMDEITRDLGGELVDLAFSVKTASSVEEKITRLVRKGMTEKQAIQSMGDLVRYTQLQPPEKLSASVGETIAKLKEKGYNITEVDNKYLDPSPGYKGIHVKAQSPGGQSFELQFHTPESLKAKKEAHDLYERFRKLPKGSAERERLEAEANSKFEHLRHPPGITDLDI